MGWLSLFAPLAVLNLGWEGAYCHAASRERGEDGMSESKRKQPWVLPLWHPVD